MDERRQKQRWTVSGDKDLVVSSQDQKKQASLIDISTGGMRFSCSRPLEVGDTIEGEFSLPPSGGPFFIKGRVDRVSESSGMWEIAVVFEKVSTIPFEER